MMEDLMVRHLNDECTPEESRKLIAWLKESPDHADQFMRFAAIHGQLRTQFQSQLSADEAGVPLAEVAFDQRPRKLRYSPRGAFGLALAACLLVLLALREFRPADPGDDPRRSVGQSPVAGKVDRTVATLIHVVGPLTEGPELVPGGRLEPGVVKIEAGVALLRFDQAVEVTLQGPAELKIFSADETRLEFGLLAAYVPPGAEGFRVDTPRLEVVDLGTFFGVRAGPDGSVDVSVFEGAVSLQPSADEGSQILREGNAMRLADGVSLEAVAVDTKSFAGVWEMASGILEYSEAFAVPQPPQADRSMQSDTTVFVYREGGFAPLSDDVRVNISRPAEYWKVSDLTESTIPRGTVVRSYLLQFRPKFRKVVRAGQYEFLNVKGELTFTDPIAGVIILEDELVASERILADKVAGRPRGLNRSLELSDKDFGDFLAVSEDRRTLKVHLRATTGFSDHIRVLVQPVGSTR